MYILKNNNVQYNKEPSLLLFFIASGLFSRKITTSSNLMFLSKISQFIKNLNYIYIITKFDLKFKLFNLNILKELVFKNHHKINNINLYIDLFIENYDVHVYLVKINTILHPFIKAYYNLTKEFHDKVMSKNATLKLNIKRNKFFPIGFKNIK